jgi:DNA topoisomerase I
MPPRKRARKEDEDEDREESSEEDEDEDNEDGDSGSGSGSDSDSGSGSDNDSDDEDGDNSDNDDEDEGEEEEEEEAPKTRGKRAAAVKKATPAKRKAAATKKTTKKATKTKGKTKATKSKTKKKKEKKEKSGEPRIHKLKALKKSERLEEARKAYKWWEAPKLPAGINWQYLEHPGIKFAPSYVRHDVPLLYDGKVVELTAEAEEIATFYAAMPLDGPQLGNEKTRPVFQRNFFEDFKEVLGPGHVIQDFDKCDFSEIRKHLEIQKNLKKVATDEEKQAKKADKERDFLRHGYALIDGRVEKVWPTITPIIRYVHANNMFLFTFLDG